MQANLGRWREGGKEHAIAGLVVQVKCQEKLDGIVQATDLQLLTTISTLCRGDQC